MAQTKSIEPYFRVLSVDWSIYVLKEVRSVFFYMCMEEETSFHPPCAFYLGRSLQQGSEVTVELIQLHPI